MLPRLLLARGVSRAAARTVTRSFSAAHFETRSASSGSQSVTYSGGQATEGQGGWYGSGGARKIEHDDINSEGRNKVLALAADVQHIQDVVKEVETLESLLRSEQEEGGDQAVTSKTIELKSSLKKLITDPKVVESLNNLEIQGEPVWGLSCEEREMCVMLREKMNEV